jgi:hypothetical protein
MTAPEKPVTIETIADLTEAHLGVRARTDLEAIELCISGLPCCCRGAPRRSCSSPCSPQCAS